MDLLVCQLVIEIAQQTRDKRLNGTQKTLSMLLLVCQLILNQNCPTRDNFFFGKVSKEKSRSAQNLTNRNLINENSEISEKDCCSTSVA